ncbi:MAG: hypothetical protein KGJ45_11565 [Elusimicrobia bacterium]|nr:hypothetical protein [Elusimicrobiota bacterium]
MLWQFVLGLGSTGGTSLSWIERADLPPMTHKKALDLAERAADLILEYAVKRAKTEDRPLLGTFAPMKVAFSARVVAPLGNNGAKVEAIRGPEEFVLDDVGIAIRVGRDAVFNALKQLGTVSRSG